MKRIPGTEFKETKSTKRISGFAEFKKQWLAKQRRRLRRRST